MGEVEIKVFGRVQGVNFRASIKDFCSKEGIKGYVMNREDGSVIIAAQSGKEKIEKLKDFIKSSPVFSKVSRIEDKLMQPKAKYADFSIVRNGRYFVDKARGILNLGKSILRKSKEKIPEHIAIIPDGNRRWAKEKGIDASFGHYTAGSFGHIFELFDEARSSGVKYLSLWGFSTENWNRSKREVNAIFSLILKAIPKMREEFNKNKIRFRHLGRKDRLPNELLNELEKLEKETSKYSDFNVQLCLDYGGRDEIIRAMNKMLKEGIKDVDENVFAKYLDSANIPDPALIIRTSGEKRLSGFMPFQSAYAEFYFLDVYFPEFDAHELKKAIMEFGERERRYGN